ncbi:MAG: DUF3276 family protein [bacterium]|nr:DUF3276 family protein [Candidatus Minthenecus merdequi]
MEDFKNERKEQEIVFSKAVKAGKRIYYLDVKKSRNNDLFLSITESKKKFLSDEENAPFAIEKHKIFLYKEDFDKFQEALTEIIGFINKNNEMNGVQDIRFRRFEDQNHFDANINNNELPTDDPRFDVNMNFEI